MDSTICAICQDAGPRTRKKASSGRSRGKYDGYPLLSGPSMLPLLALPQNKTPMVSSDAGNRMPVAKARRDYTRACDQTMATAYQNLSAHQCYLDFPRPPPLKPEWNAPGTSVRCSNKENLTENDMGQPVYWPSYEKPWVPPALKQSPYFYPSSFSKDAFHDIAEVQIDDSLNPCHFILPRKEYDEAQDQSLTSTTSYEPLSAADTLSLYDTVHSSVGQEWFDYDPVDISNPSEFTSSASIELPSIANCISNIHGASLPPTLGEGVQNECESYINQSQSLMDHNNAQWDSFLNIGTYQASLNRDDPTQVDMTYTQNQELLAEIYDPPLPVLEANGTFDQDLQQAQANTVFSDDEETAASKLEKAKDGDILDEKAYRIRQSQRDVSVDRKLIEWKQQGLSYKEIKERGEFQEAESTLRGRYRTLTKSRQDRLRKPVWPESAVNALLDAVDHFAGSSGRSGSRGRKHTLNKIPWKRVAEWMVAERGCYRYGNATVKKKYQELQQTR